ncbi:MAG TPA: alpha-amylase/4-alpha-glucanotransferase domain-containing protein [Dehalococcoidia bacterium]|nr:alpha-amylase/4-alpha-glucanotransferase domain-containing protein [Dehalococcoidia bacterium]
MRLNLALVLHNHQPVGNYGFVFDDVYRRAYLPLLECLERHPSIRVAMHHSGCLFDWLEANRPEYLDLLKRLVDRGQIELVSGGYYEPILSMLAEDDRVGQIRKLSTYLKDRFGQQPTGMWLAERVWEPEFAWAIDEAGLDWTLVDDRHFKLVGLTDADLNGAFITEDQGRHVHIFAGSQRLRYIIPWREVDDVIAELRGLARDDPSTLVVLGDDGEKFGSWPTTYEYVWERGWMDRFFEAIECNSDWLRTITPGEYNRTYDARGLVYLPTASYSEMMEWALPPEASSELVRLRGVFEAAGRDDVLRYLNGGFWRSFLSRYSEANAMHKRGVRVHDKLNAAAKLGADVRCARTLLWTAQCNCPYWHGVFGGLYLRHIRAATHTFLVAAEREADRLTHHAPYVEVRQADFDFDGKREVLVQTPALSLMVHPAFGGMLSEWDLRGPAWSLVNTLTRRREAYHERLLEAESLDAPADEPQTIHSLRIKERGLERYLVYDRRRRCAAQDALVHPSVTAETCATNGFEPLYDFADKPFVITGREEAIDLLHEGLGLRLTKRYVVEESAPAFEVFWELTNLQSEPLIAAFVSEWNLSPPQAPLGDDRIHLLRLGHGDVDLTAGPGHVEQVTEFELRGSATYGVRARLHAPADVWHFPIETVSNSEAGLERALQGVCLALRWPLDLAPGGSVRLTMRWDVAGDAPEFEVTNT